jgi:hypothetical protein
MCSGRRKETFEKKIGDVAEFAVAMRCRAMGLRVGPVGGNAPLCDLLVGDTALGKSRMIEVKGTVGVAFIVGKLPRKDDRVYVFVCFKNGEKLKAKDQHYGKMDFYILTSEEVKDCWASNLGWEEGGVRLTKIEQYKDQWYKINEKRKQVRTERQKKSDRLLSVVMKEKRHLYYKNNNELRASKTRSSFMKVSWREVQRRLKSDPKSARERGK